MEISETPPRPLKILKERAVIMWKISIYNLEGFFIYNIEVSVTLTFLSNPDII